MDARVPPQNLDAERAVIGSILIDNSVIDKIVDTLNADFFYDPRNSIIFESMVELFNNSRPVDVLTLSTELKKKKKFKQIGGAMYLTELVSAVPTSANVKQYAEIVKEMHMRRNLITLGAKLDENARNENEKLEEIINDIEQNILNISQNTTEDDFSKSGFLIEAHLERADKLEKDPDAFKGLPTGKSNIDKILGGFHNSDLIVMAGRPGTGKSAMAFDIARHIAVNEKKSIAIFSLEMPALQVMQRMIAQQMQANLWNIRTNRLAKEEFDRSAEAYGRLGDSKLLINDTAGISIVQLRSKVRKLMIEGNIDMIIIDYLQLMQTRDTENRAFAIGEISRSLKILARELNVPVLCLSQLNRAVENRPDKTPQLSDLRESGSIEQDADVVIFLSRDEDVDYDPNVEQKIPISFIVAKHRNGPIGRCKLEFIAAQQRFVDVLS